MLTEEQIEHRVEVATNRYDNMLMRGAVSQKEYDSFMQHLAQWAEAKYAERRHQQIRDGLRRKGRR